MKTRLLIVALAINLASATLMHAQQQTGPSGTIGWSETATLCKLLPTSPAARFNYFTGAVTFTATSYGTIGLYCPVTAIGNNVGLLAGPGGPAESPINSFAFSFSDPGGQEGGCDVEAYLVDRTALVSTGWVNTQSWSGSPWTVDVFSSAETYPLNPKHFYEVNIYLKRPKSGVGVCSPTAYGAYLEWISLIQ